MKKDLEAFLLYTPFFGGISKSVIERVLSLSEQRILVKDELFFNEGDQANSMFVLLSGSVEVYKTRQGENHVIAKLKQGDCFGEMSVIDHCPRSATVKAVEDCEAFEIGGDCFSAVYHDDLKQYALLQMNIGREVSRRLREANELLFSYRVDGYAPETQSLGTSI